MPIEMPVVVSQAAGANSAARDLEEHLVTRLMLDEAADVRLIGSLQQLQSSSTDQLMLERMSGEFVFLGWQSPQQSLERFASLGIPGRRAAHAADPQPPQQMGRRVYFFDLSNHPTIDSLIHQIKQCSADRTTKTIQIGLGASGPQQRTAPTIPTRPQTPSSPSSVQPSATPVAAISDDSAGPSVPSDSDDAIDDALESLVDELDQMDL